MSNRDGDKIYNDIVEKIKSGKEITKQDIIALTFTPIMGGKVGIADKIINAKIAYYIYSRLFFLHKIS